MPPKGEAEVTSRGRLLFFKNEKQKNKTKNGPLSLAQHSIKLREPRKASYNQAGVERQPVARVMTSGMVKS